MGSTKGNEMITETAERFETKRLEAQALLKSIGDELADSLDWSANWDGVDASKMSELVAYLRWTEREMFGLRIKGQYLTGQR